MSLRTWLLFCATETVLCLTPGPAVLLVISQAISRGAWPGLAATLGILTANVFYFALSATGVGALLLGSSKAFAIVKRMGAAYLVWLGARMIFARRATAASTTVTAPRRASFSAGVVTQGANPKALIFFVAILPQFIDPAADVLLQILILGVTSLVIEFVVLGAYVATCHAARGVSDRPEFAMTLQRAGGVLLVVVGAIVVASCNSRERMASGAATTARRRPRRPARRRPRVRPRHRRDRGRGRRPAAFRSVRFDPGSTRPPSFNGRSRIFLAFRRCRRRTSPSSKSGSARLGRSLRHA